MSRHPHYDKGDWKAICDSCGREFQASDLRKRWDGFMVCQDDWEPRHPQDFVRGVADIQVPPWIRDEAQDQFVSPFAGSTTVTTNYTALPTDSVLYVQGSTPLTITLPGSPSKYQVLTCNNSSTATVTFGIYIILPNDFLSLQWNGTTWQRVLGKGQVN